MSSKIVEPLLHISDTFPFPLVSSAVAHLPSNTATPPIPLLENVPLQASGWETLLKPHPDRIYAQTIATIIRYGVKIGYTGPPNQQIISKNLASSTADPGSLTKDLAKQVAAGRIQQVPKPTPTERFICSPLGLVPKADGTWRRIHHLSAPVGNSVNDHIPSEWGALEYATFDQALALVAETGRNSILVKRDLADAFRHIPVAQEDQWLLGFRWEDQFWIDCFLPFGLRTAPFLFDLFAKGLHWVMAANPKFAVPGFAILHYLDDFLAIGPQSADALAFDCSFASACQELGFRIKTEKSTTGMLADFCGLEIDTHAMQARLPLPKLEKARNLVASTIRQRSLTLVELQSLVGFLSFCTKVVPTGRVFLRRLYTALSEYTSPHHRRRLSSHAMDDLRWWNTFLPTWNGITLIRTVRHEIRIWTDASGTRGLGGYYLQPSDDPLPQQWKMLTWDTAYSKPIPRHHRGKDINYKEMLAVLTAFRSWNTEIAGHKVVLHTDNTAVFHGLQKSSMKGKAMIPLREVKLLCAQLDIELTLRWVPTKENLIADLLSRRDFGKLANFAPQLGLTPPKTADKLLIPSPPESPSSPGCSNTL